MRISDWSSDVCSSDLLQQFDRNAVWRADESHVAVARRAVDRDARIHQALARLVDIVDAIGDVAEIAAAVIALLVPVPGQFQLRVLVAGRCKVDQREAALFIVVPTNLPQPQPIVESEAFLDIGPTAPRAELFTQIGRAACRERGCHYVLI